jgi:hypothetical protein
MTDEFDLQPGATTRRAPWESTAPAPIRGAVPDPVALVFPSRSIGTGNPPHVVTVTSADTPFLTCTCQAFLGVLSAIHGDDDGGRRRSPLGCWAMKRTRAILGLPEPATAA